MLALLLLAATAAADAPRPRCGVEMLDSAVAAYARGIETRDVAGTAARYGADGVLAGPDGQEITGAEAVRALLDGFSAFKVARQRMTIVSLTAAGTGAAANTDSAWRVTGRFDQQGIDPDEAAYHVQGRFDSLWSCAANRWQISYMATTPDVAQP